MYYQVCQFRMTLYLVKEVALNIHHDIVTDEWIPSHADPDTDQTQPDVSDDHSSAYFPTTILQTCPYGTDEHYSYHYQCHHQSPVPGTCS